MKFKFNSLTGEFNLVPDSGTLKQKLNWLTGEFNLTKDAGKYKQIYNAIEGEFNLRPAITQVIVHGVGSIQLTNAVENGLLSLKAYGGTEQSNLPKGYTQLEYITFSNTYIDSGIVPTTFDYEIETKGSFTTTAGGPNCARGYMASASSGNKPRWLLATYSSSYLLNANTTQSISNADTDVHIFKGIVYYDNGTAKWSSHIDGEQKQDVQLAEIGTWENNTLSIYIGGRNKDGTAGSWGNGNLYYYKVTKAGVVIQHLIPCKRNSDNEVGLYDLVTNTFFENDGNGTITAGPNAVPTPTEPMNIVSNNGVLKFSKNMANVNTQTALVGYYISAQGQVLESPYNRIYQDYIPCKPNTKYTISMSSPVHYITISEYVSASDSGFYRRNAGVTGGNTKLTITTDANTTYLRFGANLSSSNITIDDVLAIDWQLEIGDTPTQYHEYVEGGVYVDGTTETIGVKDPNNILPVNAEPDVLYPVNVVSAGTWMASAKVNGGQELAVCEIRYYNASKEQINYYTINNYDSDSGRMYRSFTVTTATRYVSISRKSAYSTTPVVDLKVEVGSNMTPYYSGGTATAEMLLKIGDYVDEQEILSGNIIRKVGVKIFDGSENFGTSNATFTYGISDKISSKTPLICSHFEYSTKTSSQVADGKIISFSSTNIGFRYDTCANTTAFKQWLTTQYNAGTPVVVLYPLATPTTESVAGQTMNIQAGDNTIEITQASLDNLELEATYEQEA